jgi:hypothetical protein
LFIDRLLASSSLLSGKHTSILTVIQTKVNKKMEKKVLFLADRIPIRRSVARGWA